ncbi:MAG: hypothetical protein ACKVVT_12385 [Dehalococcoidia bacterium]
MRLDRLRRDIISIESPPTPRWQLSGDWVSVPAARTPPEVGVRMGRPALLFGERPDRRTIALEVTYAGKTERFETGARGYLIHLDGFRGVPERVRGLDSTGAVVWERSDLRRAE